MSFPDFQVENRLCLNGQAIPVETKDMILVDPLNLADTNSLDLPESIEVTLISFKASGDMNWLCKSLPLPGGDGRNCSKRQVVGSQLNQSSFAHGDQGGHQEPEAAEDYL